MTSSAPALRDARGRARNGDAPIQLDPLPADADVELVGEFVAECGEYMAEAEAALLALEATPDDAEAVHTVFRAFHSVKGTAGFVGVPRVAELAHHAESLLNSVRRGERRYAQTADLALQAVDMLKSLLLAVQDLLDTGAGVMPAGYAQLLRLLAAAEPTRLPQPAPPPEPPPVQPFPLPPAEAPGDDRPPEGAGNPPPAHTPSARSGQPASPPLRVRTERVDRLIDSVGELVIAHSQVVQDEAMAAAGQDLARKVGHTDKVLRELQDLALTMRMVPLQPTFQRIARLVRDLAHKSGKIVEFVADGDDTEVDRNLVDLLADPLMHLVRNAVDHGIEPTEMRERQGKPRAGTVRLTAHQSGGSVVVELEDDGRGLDQAAIVRHAAAKRLLPTGTPAAALSDEAALALIFQPGFSTAERVTEISGRGVGLDVVLRGIETLRGSVAVRSTPGRGCTFVIRLPLTLALTDGMLVRAGEERFIVPTASIVHSFRPEPHHLSTVAGRGELVMLRGEVLPVFRLHRLFGIPGTVEDAAKAILIVVDSGREVRGGAGHVGRYALLVDDLLEQQRVVAKSLGGYLGKLPAISGAAILGDGRVRLILDPVELGALACRTARSMG